SGRGAAVQFLAHLGAPVGRSILARVSIDTSHACGIPPNGHLVVVIARGYPNVPIPDRITVVIVATIAAIKEDPAMMESLMHDSPIEACARKGTRHRSEAARWTSSIDGAESSSGVATGISNAVACAETSAAVASASAAMTATPGNCF